MSAPLTRKRFLVAIGATAAAAGIGACGSSSASSSGTPTSGTPASGTATSSQATVAGDLEIVNFALTLEHVQAQLYRQAIAAGALAGSPALGTVERFAAQEEQHIAALSAAARRLGTTSPPPLVKFQLRDATAALTLAVTLENAGAAAYLGQLPSVSDKRILALLLSIQSVEARHATALELALAQAPLPQPALARPLSMPAALAVIKPFVAG